MTNIKKLTVSALIIIAIILGLVKISMDNLKQEAENGFKEISKLHANMFSDQIHQVFDNINISIDNLSRDIQNEIYVKENIKSILSKNAYIRSINIINDKNIITYSSNKNNLHQRYDISKYYPTPMFNGHVLRVGNVAEGRDLYEKAYDIHYIPIVKTITSNAGKYSILIVLNADYITNRYQIYLTNYSEELEIIRFDNTLLYSSLNEQDLGKSITPSKLYERAQNKNLSSGIEYIENKKFIVAYHLTEIYPLVVSIKLDYVKNLAKWENKTIFTLFLIGSIISLIAFILIKLTLKYQKSQTKEIEYQKEQIINQDNLRNAYIVYNNANDGILITDANCKIIDVNKSFTSNTGYTLKEVYGKNPRILSSKMYDKQFYKNMWDQIESDNYWHGEIINKDKNGSLYTESLTINKVIEGNTVKNYIGVFTNITFQKAQENLLHEKEQLLFRQSKMAAMGEMLENIAHQWRQPLSIISTASTGSLLEMEYGLLDKDKEKERFELINDTTQHLSKTIDDFRNFFKPNKNKEEFLINHAIEQSLKILSSKFKNRNIHVITNIENITIIGYQSELIQVIMNLLNNARDALEEKEKNKRFIFIDVLSSKNDSILTIKDSGGGIPEHITDKIFDPYFTTKHKAQGTGIGLYMSEEIVTKHLDGIITVNNVTFEHEGIKLTGAEFKIIFK